LKDLDQAVQIAPHDLSPYFQRAVLRADAGNGDGALADLDHALYIDPMNPASRAARAGLFEAGGRTSEAQLDRDIATRQIDTFKSGKRSALDRLVDTWRGKPVKLSAISPQESTDPIKGALDAVGAGRYRAGLAILDAALAKDPSDDAVRGLRGQLHGAIGQANQAVEDLSSVIQRHPTAAMLVGRGLAYRQLCQFREELADYDRAVREDPKYAKAYFERAHTTMHYRKGNDPAPDLTKVIDLEPDNWMAYYMRGQEYGYWYAKIPLAMADYRKVIELKPDFARPYCDIAFALQEQGRKGEVEPWLQKCFALDPTERAVAKEALGKVQLKEQLLKREMEIRAWMRSLRPRCSVEETLRWSCAMFY
jgi:tetratricopeptide (TPR) repeat protein